MQLFILLTEFVLVNEHTAVKAGHNLCGLNLKIYPLEVYTFNRLAYF